MHQIVRLTVIRDSDLHKGVHQKDSYEQILCSLARNVFQMGDKSNESLVCGNEIRVINV